MSARTVLAADGLPRRAFTIADLDRMVEAGIVGPEERLEIVHGELIPRADKSADHEILKREMNYRLVRGLPPEALFIPETGWRLEPTLYLEPDFLIFPAGVRQAAVTGRDALLVIELSDSTLGYDLGRKPALYAGEGVREYWVIDAARRVTHVHRDLAGDRYRAVTAWPAEADLRPQRIPGFSVRLADFPED
ncbi:hypothetical protein C2U72_25725 [Prosthecomicrobium hirschii]|uniref:Uma2 family endonuclease n=1 Tax=Prosthecodimorpha hirschii TaxID=665126 RepID=UPI00112CFEB6|nr:Uma2 family endonuclease [Prosthecomicrobium hirschii]TPQ46285.1 hypothetical protein C2U72_25725 [Prosthecomicrobium hirschii]